MRNQLPLELVAGVLTELEHDKGFDGFTLEGVGFANYGSLSDSRMAHQGTFDLGGTDTMPSNI